MGNETPKEDKIQSDIILSRRDLKRLSKIHKRWRNIKTNKLKPVLSNIIKGVN